MPEMSTFKKKESKLKGLIPAKTKKEPTPRVITAQASIEDFSQRLKPIGGEIISQNKMQLTQTPKDIPSVFALSKELKRALGNISKP